MVRGSRGRGLGWVWMNKANSMNSKGKMTLHQTRINLSSNVQYIVHTIFLTGDGVENWEI